MCYIRSRLMIGFSSKYNPTLSPTTNTQTMPVQRSNTSFYALRSCSTILKHSKHISVQFNASSTSPLITQIISLAQTRFPLVCLLPWRREHLHSSVFLVHSPTSHKRANISNLYFVSMRKGGGYQFGYGNLKEHAKEWNALNKHHYREREGLKGESITRRGDNQATLQHYPTIRVRVRHNGHRPHRDRRKTARSRS